MNKISIEKICTLLFTILTANLIANAKISTANASETERSPQGSKVGEIDPAKKDKYNTRYEAKSSNTFSFGPGFASHLNNTNTLYVISVGHEWEAGSQGAVLVEATGGFGSSTTFAGGIIGGKYFFSDEDFSPMLKGGFGFGAAKGEDLETASGFMGTVGVGLTFFRTSSVHLEVIASQSLVFKTNANGNPGLSSLTLGLLF